MVGLDDPASPVDERLMTRNVSAVLSD